MTYDQWIQWLKDYIAAHSVLAVIALCLSIAVLVLSIIAMWKIFTKAGEKGWKAIIPIYNFYILFKIAWTTKSFWQYLLVIILSSVFTGLAGIPSIAQIAVLATVFTILGVIATIVGFIMMIILYLNLSKAYGHGIGFAIGLIFLEVIFVMILGFGNSKYVGNPEKSED